MSRSIPQQIPVRVVETVAVTSEIKRFRFEAVNQEALPAFSGGAHILVEIPGSDGARRNAYSLTGSPRDVSSYAISVRRDDQGRGGSRLLHDTLKPGTVLNVGMPVNLFQADRRARKHLMIAGGIGITPFLALGEELLHEQECFELHYAVRSLEHGAYIDDVRQRFGDRVRIYASDRGQRLSFPPLLRRQPLGTHLYVCGPARLIDHTQETARGLGWPESAIHFERFTAPVSGKPYQVQLVRSGRAVAVDAHQSMLEAIEDAGVTVPYLCRGGACGQCRTPVVTCDGTLLHADHFLSDAEKALGRFVMPCVSRFEGKSLALDL
jgi:dimethylamine monooxygenase subunit B